MTLLSLLLIALLGTDISEINALASTTTPSATTKSLLSPESLAKISRGGVAIEHNWLSPTLTKSLKSDARVLFKSGQFQPDGLTNTARSRSEQGFVSNADRQTFRGGAGWNSDVGDRAARMEFADRMRALRTELAIGLDRPTLEAEGTLKHEMTYNWYEPGAKLGRHLDEHHEETKGTKGWMLPTRRSVTWLVYLNDDWKEDEGGALRCFSRGSDYLSSAPVGAHKGNLQVGWVNKKDPVFLDCFRPSGLAALYTLSRQNNSGADQIRVLSTSDFDVPRQPVEFATFLAKEFRNSFEQISTSRLDPRFAAVGSTSVAVASNSATLEEKNAFDIIPAGGTLVVFDSVVLPHLVREVTASRQRIAATGWFHEDSQFVIEI